MLSHTPTPPVVKFEQHKPSRTIHSINELEHLYSLTSFNQRSQVPNEQDRSLRIDSFQSSPKSKLGDLVLAQRNSISSTDQQQQQRYNQQYQSLNKEQVQYLVSPQNKKWLNGLRRLFEVLLCRG